MVRFALLKPEEAARRAKANVENFKREKMRIEIEEKRHAKRALPGRKRYTVGVGQIGVTIEGGKGLPDVELRLKTIEDGKAYFRIFEKTKPMDLAVNFDGISKDEEFEHGGRRITVEVIYQKLRQVAVIVEEIVEVKESDAVKKPSEAAREPREKPDCDPDSGFDGPCSTDDDYVDSGVDSGVDLGPDKDNWDSGCDTESEGDDCTETDRE